MKIYYNPKCSKCRVARTFLEESGEDLEIIEYMLHPPTPSELKEILRKLGMQAQEIVRTKEEEWKQFSNKQLDEEKLIKILAAHPKLIQRPIVVKGNQAWLVRDDETMRKLVPN